MFCLFFTGKAAAQNGISIEKVQNDPYFTTGSAFAPEDEQGAGEGGSGGSGLQMTDPDNPDTFYNAENWSGGIRKDFNDDDSSSQNGEDGNSNPGDFSDEEKPLLSDSQKGSNGAFSFNSSKVNVSAGYMFFYSPTFLPNSFASYFDQFFGFEFLGANAKVEYFLFGNENYKIGVGAFGSYSFLYQKKNKYKLYGHLYTADALFLLKLCTQDYDQLEFRLGAGWLGINDLYYKQPDNGLESEHTDWLYPEVRVGASYDFFIYNHVGFTFGCDFSWPFVFENFYPRLELSVGLIGRF